jgi:hypothetical protein
MIHEYISEMNEDMVKTPDQEISLLFNNLNINYNESSIELKTIIKEISHLDLNIQNTILEIIKENNYKNYLDIYLICVENDIHFLAE